MLLGGIAEATTLRQNCIVILSELLFIVICFRLMSYSCLWIHVYLTPRGEDLYYANSIGIDVFGSWLCDKSLEVTLPRFVNRAGSSERQCDGIFSETFGGEPQRIRCV